MRRNQYMVHSVGTYRTHLLLDDQCNECNRDIDCNLLSIRYMVRTHLKIFLSFTTLTQGPWVVFYWSPPEVDRKIHLFVFKKAISVDTYSLNILKLFGLMRHKFNKDWDSLKPFKLDYRRSQSRVRHMSGHVCLHPWSWNSRLEWRKYQLSNNMRRIIYPWWSWKVVCRRLIPIRT